MQALIRTLINERLVCYIILFNTLTVFLDAFPPVHAATSGWLSPLDQICTVYFTLEILLKIKLNGMQVFWRSGWNRLDFWIVILALPSLLTFFWQYEALTVLLLLRVGRLIKFFRLLRFTPNGEHIWAGILRSLKASISVFLAIFLLNLLFAMGATFLFREWAPEYFGDPFLSWYSIFKVFTVEGWYEVPDLMYERSGAASWAIALRVYYIIAVFVGGLLGLALANAVFVDEMTSDNTAYVEELVKELSAAQARFRDEVHAEQQQVMESLRQEIITLRQLLEQRYPP